MSQSKSPVNLQLLLFSVVLELAQSAESAESGTPTARGFVANQVIFVLRTAQGNGGALRIVIEENSISMLPTNRELSVGVRLVLVLVFEEETEILDRENVVELAAYRMH